MVTAEGNGVGSIQGAKGRRERYSNEMRADILRAARELIAEEGAGALSIRGVARRIGYSAPALYEYFSGKEAIAEALFVSGFEQLREAMEHVARTVPDPIERIQQMAHAYRDFARTHPEEYQLMFSRPVPEFKPSDDLLKQIATSGFAPLQEAVAAGMRGGEMREGDVRIAATTAWALMHGLVSLDLAGMRGPPHDLPPGVVAPAYIPAIYDAALGLFARGLRAAPAQTDGAPTGDTPTEGEPT